jgi:hypothetical protein
VQILAGDPQDDDPQDDDPQDDDPQDDELEAGRPGYGQEDGRPRGLQKVVP